MADTDFGLTSTVNLDDLEDLHTSLRDLKTPDELTPEEATKPLPDVVESGDEPKYGTISKDAVNMPVTGEEGQIDTSKLDPVSIVDTNPKLAAKIFHDQHPDKPVTGFDAAYDVITAPAKFGWGVIQSGVSTIPEFAKGAWETGKLGYRALAREMAEAYATTPGTEEEKQKAAKEKMVDQATAASALLHLKTNLDTQGQGLERNASRFLSLISAGTLGHLDSQLNEEDTIAHLKRQAETRKMETMLNTGDVKGAINMLADEQAKKIWLDQHLSFYDTAENLHETAKNMPEAKALVDAGYADSIPAAISMVANPENAFPLGKVMPGGKMFGGLGLRATGRAVEAAGSILDNPFTKYTLHHGTPVGAGISLMGGHPGPAVALLASNALPYVGKGLKSTGGFLRNAGLELGFTPEEMAAYADITSLSGSHPGLLNRAGTRLIQHAAEGGYQMSPFMLSAQSPEEAGQTLGGGLALGLIGGAAREGVKASMFHLKGGDPIGLSSNHFDYGVPDDALHKQAILNLQPEELADLNRQRHALNGLGKVFVLPEAEFTRRFGNGEGVFDRGNVYYNDAEGYRSAAAHEPIHMLAESLTTDQRAQVDKALLKINDPSAFASKYYSLLKGEKINVDFDKLPDTVADQGDKLGMTKRNVLDEMLADSLKNFSFSDITKNPSIIRKLQLGAGMMAESAMGMPMSSLESNGIIGVNPSYKAVSMIERIARQQAKKAVQNPIPEYNFDQHFPNVKAALKGLGYKNSDAERMAQDAIDEATNRGIPVEEEDIVKRALGNKWPSAPQPKAPAPAPQAQAPKAPEAPQIDPEEINRRVEEYVNQGIPEEQSLRMAAAEVGMPEQFYAKVMEHVDNGIPPEIAVRHAADDIMPPKGVKFMPKGFYTRTERVAEEKIKNRMPVAQALGILKNNGVSPHEMEWLGLNDMEGEYPKGVTSKDIQDYAKAHAPPVNVTTLSEQAANQIYQEANDTFRDLRADPGDYPELKRLSTFSFPPLGVAEKIMEMRTLAHVYNTHGDAHREGMVNKYIGLLEEGRKLGKPQYGPEYHPELSEPGAEVSNYKEHLFNLPEKENPDVMLLHQRLNAARDKLRAANKAKEALEGLVTNAFYAGEPTEHLEAQRNQANHNANLAHINYMNIGDRLRKVSREAGPSVLYESPHFSGHEKNLLFHSRTTDRTTSEGKRMTFGEELQSDWVSAAREAGYKREMLPEEKSRLEELQAKDTKAGEGLEPAEADELIKLKDLKDLEKGVAKTPFPGNMWSKLAMRHLIKQAVDAGHDSIGWTSGKMQIDRYNLGKKIDSIVYKNYPGLKERGVYLYPKEGANTLHSTVGYDGVIKSGAGKGNKLSDLVGKETANKIMGSEGDGELKGVDLQVGGEGKQAFYDRQLVNIANDIGKKFGAKAGVAHLDTGVPSYSVEVNKGTLFNPKWEEVASGFSSARGARNYASGTPEISDLTPAENIRIKQQHTGTEPIHELPITDAMRESVMKHGQPLFMPSGAPDAIKQSVIRRKSDGKFFVGANPRQYHWMIPNEHPHDLADYFGMDQDKKYENGFLNNKGEFRNRDEAFGDMLKNGQLPPGFKPEYAGELNVTALRQAQEAPAKEAPAEQPKFMPDVNVGLKVGDEVKLKPEDVISAIEALPNMKVTYHSVQQSGTEPTVVASLSRKMTPEEGHAVSEALGQESIAQRTKMGEGELFGPKAKEWGPYKSEYYMTHQGKPESETMGQTQPQGRWDSMFVEGQGEQAKKEIANLLRIPSDKRFYEQKPRAQEKIREFYKTRGEEPYRQPEAPEAIHERAIETKPKTEEDAKQYLKPAQQEKVGAQKDLPDGTDVGVRIDIPAFNSHGKFVQTVHSQKADGAIGAPVGYSDQVKLDGPISFYSNEPEAAKIRKYAYTPEEERAAARESGEAHAKSVVATVRGKIDNSPGLPEGYEKWTPVGYNPVRHSYFYDKQSMKPVIGGDRSVHMGNTVYVENAVPGNPQAFKYMPRTEAEAQAAIKEGKVKYPEAFPREYERNEDGTLKLKFNVKTKQKEAIPVEKPFSFQNSGLWKDVGGDEQKFIRAMVDKVKNEHDKLYVTNPDVASAKGWYDIIGTLKKRGFTEEQAQRFIDLMAVTSPRARAGQQWFYALDANNKFENGDYDGMIKDYLSAYDKLAKGDLKNKDGTVVTSPSEFRDYVEKNIGVPLQSNQQKFGMHSYKVLKVLAGHWKEATEGLKVIDFSGALHGISTKPVIDIWTYRSLDRLANEGHKKVWRRLQENEPGVSDPQYVLGQKIMQQAAEELGYKNPTDLQAMNWFNEKHIWYDRGWQKDLDLGDYRPLIDQMVRRQDLPGLQFEPPPKPKALSTQRKEAEKAAKKAAKKPKSAISELQPPT